jgi:hypothetical protein
MLEQSLRKLFEQQAEVEPPPGLITVASVLRQGRLRRRRHLIGAAGTPVLAAVAVAAIALTGALPSGSLGHSGPQTHGNGEFAGGAFDPSYLAINFSWLPKGTTVTGGQTSPGEETISAYAKRADWLLTAYARNMCHAMMTERRFSCSPTVWPEPPGSPSAVSITGRGPVIDSHRSLWLSVGAPHTVPRLTLVWEYAPNAWALVQNWFGPSGAATAVRIARTAEFGQHIPFRFAARFTSLPPGWRIVGLYFGSQNGRLPAGVYLATGYSIARLRKISPATPDNLGTYDVLGVPVLSVVPVIADSTGCLFVAPKQEKYTRLTIQGYRFTLGNLLQRGRHGHVRSNLDLCDAHADGMSVDISEIGVGPQPHLALSPTQLMERMQLLGNDPAGWVTNPLP